MEFQIYGSDPDKFHFTNIISVSQAVKNTATMTKYILFCYEITLLKWVSTYSCQQWTTLDRGDISWCHPLKLLYYVIQSNFSFSPRWYHLSKGGITSQYGKKGCREGPYATQTPLHRDDSIFWEKNDVNPWGLWHHDCFSNPCSTDNFFRVL